MGGLPGMASHGGSREITALDEASGSPHGSLRIIPRPGRRTVKPGEGSVTGGCGHEPIVSVPILLAQTLVAAGETAVAAATAWVAWAAPVRACRAPAPSGRETTPVGMYAGPRASVVPSSPWRTTPPRIRTTDLVSSLSRYAPLSGPTLPFRVESAGTPLPLTSPSNASRRRRPASFLGLCTEVDSAVRVAWRLACRLEFQLLVEEATGPEPGRFSWSFIGIVFSPLLALPALCAIPWSQGR